jgi:hypothetical protein
MIHQVTCECGKCGKCRHRENVRRYRRRAVELFMRMLECDEYMRNPSAFGPMSSWPLLEEALILWYPGATRAEQRRHVPDDIRINWRRFRFSAAR